MAPARLHETNPLIAKIGNRPLQKARRRDEIGVEDRHELALRFREAGLQRTGLEPFPVEPADVRNVEPLFCPTADEPGDQEPRLVGRIVQHLDLEPIARPIERAAGIDQTLDDVQLIEDRKLNRDTRVAVQWARIGVAWPSPCGESRHKEEIEADT